MQIVNDNGCSWINDLEPRSNIKTLKKNEECEWLIVGAGYTGLSAARKLGKLNPTEKIILLDAQLAGDGASGRNSGYLVDTTLNDGFSSNKELKSYKKKADIYELGIQVIKKFIKEYQVDCDWNECGKYFASSKIKDKKILVNFSETLSKLGFEHEILDNQKLTKKLGTSFYNIGLFTKGGILIHPNIKASYGMLGTTFGGNHLACVASIAVLDILKMQSLQEKTKSLEFYFKKKASQIPQVRKNKGRGLMLGLEFDFEESELRKKLIYELFMFTGGSTNKNLIRSMHPLTIKEKHFDQFFVED